MCFFGCNPGSIPHLKLNIYRSHKIALVQRRLICVICAQKKQGCKLPATTHPPGKLMFVQACKVPSSVVSFIRISREAACNPQPCQPSTAPRLPDPPIPSFHRIHAYRYNLHCITAQGIEIFLLQNPKKIQLETKSIDFLSRNYKVWRFLGDFWGYMESWYFLGGGFFFDSSKKCQKGDLLKLSE